MQRDDVCLFAGDVSNLAIAIRDVAMRRTVESITPNLVSPIELIGDRIQISSLGQRLMKRGIENRDLGQSRSEELARGLNAFYVRGVVQRRKVDAILDAAQDFVVYQNRVSESLTAVNHAMSDGMNVGDAVYAVDAGGFGRRPSNDEVNGRSHVTKRLCEASL